LAAAENYTVSSSAQMKMAITGVLKFDLHAWFAGLVVKCRLSLQ